MTAHIVFTTILLAIPLGGAYLVWDTMPAKDEKEDL